jgi:hypothetical protein
MKCIENFVLADYLHVDSDLLYRFAKVIWNM